MSSLEGEQILVLSRGLCWKILLFLFHQKKFLPFNNIVFTDTFCVNKCTIDEVLENNHVVQVLESHLICTGPVVLKFWKVEKLALYAEAQERDGSKKLVLAQHIRCMNQYNVAQRRRVS